MLRSFSGLRPRLELLVERVVDLYDARPGQYPTLDQLVLAALLSLSADLHSEDDRAAVAPGRPGLLDYFDDYGAAFSGTVREASRATGISRSAVARARKENGSGIRI